MHQVEGCMKKFWKPLTEHAIIKIKFGKKKMISLTNEEYELYPKQTAAFAKEVTTLR